MLLCMGGRLPREPVSGNAGIGRQRAKDGAHPRRREFEPASRQRWSPGAPRRTGARGLCYGVDALDSGERRMRFGFNTTIAVSMLFWSAIGLACSSAVEKDSSSDGADAGAVSVAVPPDASDAGSAETGPLLYPAYAPDLPTV